jgi:large repetitive protein
VDVLSNDGDADGDTLTVTAVGAAANGAAVLNADRTITFVPDADYHGIATFP